MKVHGRDQYFKIQNSEAQRLYEKVIPKDTEFIFKRIHFYC